MTLSTTTNKVSYAGDGSTTAFAIPFLFLENSHVEAILRDAADVETTWTLNTEFTLSGAGNTAGGTFTVLTNPTDYTPASGETLVIRRVVPVTQETDYPEGGAFPATTHEQALDKLTMLSQQQAEEIGRAMRLPVTSALSEISFPDPGDGKFIRWDANGTALETKDISTLGSLALPVDFSDGGTGASYANLAALMAGWNIEIGTDVQGYDANTAKTDVEQAWTKSQYFTPGTSTTPGATPTVDFSDSNFQRITLNANITAFTFTGLENGMEASLLIVQAAGGYTISGFPSVTWTGGDTAPDAEMPSTVGSALRINLLQENSVIYGSYQVYGA